MMKDDWLKRWSIIGVVILLVLNMCGLSLCYGSNIEKDYVNEFLYSDESYAKDGNLIEIYDWHDLDEIRNDLSANYVLMNDLDENTKGYMAYNDPSTSGWLPIGEFNGELDGDGYKIRDLYINKPFKDIIGLVWRADSGAEITDLGVTDIDVKGRERVGALVGENHGTISNSYATGDVSGEKRVGALVGENHGTISNSYATGDVSGSAKHSFVGGLMGTNFGTLSNSYATGDVSGEGAVGGLLGANSDQGMVSNSYATGDVRGEGTATVGGLVGHNMEGGTVSDSFYASNSFWSIWTGKTTTPDMVKKETFTNAGWNFEEDWYIIEGETYPFLQWQEEDTYPYAPQEELPFYIRYQTFTKGVVVLLMIIFIATGFILIKIIEKMKELEEKQADLQDKKNNFNTICKEVNNKLNEVQELSLDVARFKRTLNDIKSRYENLQYDEQNIESLKKAERKVDGLIEELQSTLKSEIDLVLNTKKIIERTIENIDDLLWSGKELSLDILVFEKRNKNIIEEYENIEYDEVNEVGKKLERIADNLNNLKSDIISTLKEKGYRKYKGEWIPLEEKKRKKKRNKEIKLGLRNDFADYDPFEFERKIAELFKEMGYNANTTSGTGDYGIDVIAEDEDEKVVIQVKKFSRGNRVNLKPVQRTIGATDFLEADRAIFITTSSYTRSAREVEKRSEKITLWNGGDLKNKFRQVYLD